MPPHITPATPLTKPQTIYFAYGSNLWLQQMRTRCPTSQYLGVARLPDYKWIINSRGYANIVSVSASQKNKPPSQAKKGIVGAYDNVVYGLVYSLQADDEQRLDTNEGVPVAYTKETLPCEFWSTIDITSTEVNVSLPPTSTREMLVYIDRKRTSPASPREEYIYRMNRGIVDAMEKGVPEEYVRDVMRRFIVAENGEERRSMEEFATKQAARFRDESGVFK